MHKHWSEMNADEKADWLRSELQHMSNLFAMMSSQIQEIGRSVKALEKARNESEGTP